METETNGTGIVTKTPTPTPAAPPAPATGQPPASQPDAAPKGGKAPKPKGINPKGVLEELMPSIDASQIKVIDLVFGTRKVGDEGNHQLVSILDTGTGKIDVYPVVSRFAPKPGHQIRCYVILKTDMVTKRGHSVERTLGFAIPVNLREAFRTGEWLDLRNNIMRIQFRAGKDGGFYGFGPNGKVVVLPEDASFEPPTDKEINIMVSETLKCYLAQCEVTDEILQEVTDEMDANANQNTGLALLAETVGAILKGTDRYGFKHSGQLFDACAVLGVPTTASMEVIDAVYRKLATTEHPDKKAAEFRVISLMEPTKEDLRTFNDEWSLIEAAKKVMLLECLREDARQRYLKAGHEAQPDMPKQILIGNLAKKLGKSTELVRKALKAVGYDGIANKMNILQLLAWTVVGYLASSTPNPSAPAEGQPATPQAPSAEAKPAAGGPDLEAFKNGFAEKVANGK